MFNSAAVEVTPSNMFNSDDEDVTRVPPNFKPPSTKSCEAISITWFPSEAPKVITPVDDWVTTLLFSELPRVVISL